MTQQVRTFARAALWALPVWAAMLFLGTLTHQPDPQKDFAGFAAYVTTTSFLLSHLINSITGAAIGSIGAVGLMVYLQDSKVAGRAIAGMVAMIISNTMVASIFGVAAFAQTAMGRMFLAGQQNGPEFYNQVYNGTLFATAAVALLLFMIGGVSDRKRHHRLRLLSTLDGMGRGNQHGWICAEHVCPGYWTNHFLCSALFRNRDRCVESRQRSSVAGSESRGFLEILKNPAPSHLLIGIKTKSRPEERLFVCISIHPV